MPTNDGVHHSVVDFGSRKIKAHDHAEQRVRQEFDRFDTDGEPST